ncbi:elongation factor Ts [Salinivibrio sp. PR932]|uniref:elongation factor Ts n=1 Tax=Salinivibrio sp. PR932 TaxID=1909492 RepID=UPI0009897462|nr:elongation factor Ts [Salinivibrio sp. PR932]OOF13500.1 elongation factor Ts [Salinivibrio sp. PR932]
MGTSQKQKQIRYILEALGWSQKQLADVLFEELYVDEHEDICDSPDAVDKFRQLLKKQLQRESTPENRLEQYIEILSEHPEFKKLKLDMIFPKYVDHQCLSDDLHAELVAFSKRLDDEEYIGS